MAARSASPSRPRPQPPCPGPDLLSGRDRGQGVVEYGLILGGSAVVAVVTLIVLGPVLGLVIDFIVGLIEAATRG
jgi:hypothetical protein